MDTGDTCYPRSPAGRAREDHKRKDAATPAAVCYSAADEETADTKQPYWVNFDERCGRTRSIEKALLFVLVFLTFMSNLPGERPSLRAFSGEVFQGQADDRKHPHRFHARGGNRSEVYESRNPPRILTVLTTYNQRSSFVKFYKQALRDRGDGYQPAVRELRGFNGNS